MVPASPKQKEIPFARVNHNKYMVTDKIAYIGETADNVHLHLKQLKYFLTYVENKFKLLSNTTVVVILKDSPLTTNKKPC